MISEAVLGDILKQVVEVSAVEAATTLEDRLVASTREDLEDSAVRRLVTPLHQPATELR